MIWLLLLFGTLSLGILVAWISDSILWRSRLAEKDAEKKLGFRTAGAVSGALYILGLVVLFSPLFYEYPGVLEKKVPVTFLGDEIVEHPYGRFEWPWQWTPSIREVVCRENKTTSFMANNPKVRKLHYSVALAMINPEQYFKTKERRVRNDTFPSDDIRKRLEYQLYEFNDQRAGELVHFYNPESKDQQASFVKLAKDFLDPLFAEDGVAVLSATFSLAD